MAVPHDSVAHAWAHNTGRARRGFNMFWEGDGLGRTVYSYGHHFPIARFVRESVVLFTTDTHSVSTSKHKTITRRAVPVSAVVYSVPDVLADTETGHKANWEAMAAEVRQCIAKAARARIYGESWLRQARGWADSANLYAAEFGLTVDALEAVELSPQAIQRVKEQEAAARAAEAVRVREALERWKVGQTDRAPHTSRPALRVRGDMLETSWGIRVPLAQALPMFRLALRCAAMGREFRPDRPHKVGGWTLDRITARGDVVAGCHCLTLAAQTDAARRAGINFADCQILEAAE